MDTTTLIRVMDHAECIEERQCRVLRLRDGRPAAVWRGFAYPLRGDGAIDINDPATAPLDCLAPAASAQEVGKDIPWMLFQGVDECWVLVAGDVLDRDRAAARLRKGGIIVLRAGAWLGEAVDGFAADWFIRIGLDGGAEVVAAKVTALLGSGDAKGPTSDSAGLRETLLRAEVMRARAEATLLREAIER